jgi:CRISPR-associated protein Cmr1
MSTDFGKIENVIEAKFRIVTPMFLGGADQQADEIRPSSVKGMLRFWWRALNWSRFRGAADATDASALQALHGEEARLFGSAATDKSGGQGVFLLSVKQQKFTPHTWTKVEPQIGYLLGMGLFHFKNGVTRSSITGEFSVALRFRDSAKQEERASILDALKAFSLLGGLGSRERRGLGSVSMTTIEGVERFSMPGNRAAYSEQVSGLLANDVAALPVFTAFSAKSKIALLEKSNANEALKAMGDELGMYRGWGREGKVFGKPAEKNFKADHDNMYAAANGQTYPDTPPKRLIFGMPHNYRFSSGGSVSIQNTVLKFQRRASPLFIHVHQFPQGESALGVMLMLPAQFLPTNDKVEIKGRGSKMLAANLDWVDMEKLLQRPAFTQGAKA